MSSNLVELTKVSLSNPDSFRIDKENLKLNFLKLKNQDLRGAFLLADRMRDWSSDIYKILREVAFEKSQSYEKNSDGSFEIPFPHGHGSIVFKQKVSTVFQENVAYDILRQHNILDECRKVSIDIDKVKEYHKAKVISDEEYNSIFIQGEPTYNLSVK